MSVAEAENAESIRDLEYMKLALHQAELALHAEEIPVGCVITLEGKVIATGYNKTNETRNGTKHAEMVAIETLLLGSAGSNGTGFDSSQFRRCSLYVTCEPCIMCAGKNMIIFFFNRSFFFYLLFYLFMVSCVFFLCIYCVLHCSRVVEVRVSRSDIWM